MNMHHQPDRIWPSNIEAEQALLGAVLVNNAAMDRVSAFLDAEHFFDPINSMIYRSAYDLIRSGRKVTPITIKSFLPSEQMVGGGMTVGQYLAALVSNSATIMNARDYGYAIHEMWIRRKAISICEDVRAVALDLPADKDILAELSPLEDELARLRAERVKGAEGLGIGQGYLESLNAAYQRREVRGVPIALGEIADVISEPCFEAANLYGLLSSSGEGKTSLTVQLIVHALKHGHPVCFLSFDQSASQILRQMVAQEHEIEARRQRDAQLLSTSEFERCVDLANWVEASPFDVLKCTDQSAAQLVAMARSFVRRRANGKVPLVVVDHIGAVTPDDRRSDEGTKAKGIAQILKAGAEMTDAAWLVLNQRNTYGMKRDNPRPISADLYGGDAAKQPFDAIFYLYRFLKFVEERKAIAASDADWKKIAKVFPSDVVNEGQDIAEIGSIKVRFGPTNIREPLTFEARFTRYRSKRETADQPSLGM